MTGWPEGLTARSWTPADAREVAGWRYPGRWSVYDERDAGRCTATSGRRAIVGADGRLIGYYCVGRDALVPGVEPVEGMTDIGVGMAPAFVGGGHGPEFLRAVLGDLNETVAVGSVRAFVQSWNGRSLALARRFGFVAIGNHRCVQDGGEVDYVVLVRQTPA